MRKLYMSKVYLVLIIFLINGCQSVKDGLTGQKKNNSDEFLIEKKNPLVLPPEFSELPEPTILIKENNIEEGIDLKKLITKKSVNSKSISSGSNSNKALEKSILEKIKKN